MVELNNSNFESEVINSDIPVFVDFYATWCGPCKMMAPVVSEMEGDYEGKVKFAKLDIDEAIEVAQKYRVASIPTFKIFKNGEAIDTLVGACSKNDIAEMIKAI